MSKIQTELSRDLSLFDITMIGVGAMIGAGVFVLTGIAAGAAGPALILSFALNGIITIFTAMVYAELGSAIPEAGGGYLWVREGLPGPNAFQAGWMSWFAHAVAGSLYALGFGAFFALVLEQIGLSLGIAEGDILHKILAVGIILIFIAINFRGVSETGLAGNIVTILKVIILGIFIVSGLYAIYLNPEFMTKFHGFAPNGWVGILSAMGLTFIAFEGYEIIVQAGEEVKNPRKTIPKAIFFSLAIVIPIYMLVAFVSIGAVNPESSIPTYQWLAEHAEIGIVEAARQFMPFGTFLLLIGGLLSTMSALNATTFSSTRVAFAMGRDKNLPDAFALVNSITRTPHIALLFSGAVIIFMAVVIPIEDVAAAADIMFMLLFLQVNVAVITLRRKYGDRLKYGYLMPFFPVVPIIGIITKLFLAVFLFKFSPIAWVFAVVWIAIGFALYYFYARPRTAKRSRTPIVLEEKRTVTPFEKVFRVLVPLANPESIPSLLQPAVRAAREHEGIVSLLHVVTVPNNIPLARGKDYIDERREILNQALRLVEKEGVEAEALMRIAHRPASAIAQTANERDVDLLVMGWRGKSRSALNTVGQNVDDIMENVNCDVIVVQQTDHPPFDKLLVPIVDPLQTAPAFDKARLMTQNGAAKIDIMHVFRPDDGAAERKRMQAALDLQVQALQNRHPNFKDNLALHFVEADDVVEAIADAAEQYDCVVLGATRDGWFKQRFFGSKPALLAERIEQPVILLRPQPGAVGFSLGRLLTYLRGGYRRIDPSAEKELTEQGILVPAGDAGSSELETSVNKVSLVLCGLLAVIAVTLMYIGDGETLTWVGALAFIVAMIWFTIISVRSVDEIDSGSKRQYGRVTGESDMAKPPAQMEGSQAPAG